MVTLQKATALIANSKSIVAKPTEGQRTEEDSEDDEGAAASGSLREMQAHLDGGTGREERMSNDDRGEAHAHRDPGNAAIPVPTSARLKNLWFRIGGRLVSSKLFLRDAKMYIAETSLRACDKHCRDPQTRRWL